MGHKINPLIFRSKLFPYYNNMWDNFQYNKSNLIYNFYLKFLFLKNKSCDFINFKFVSWNNNVNILILILQSENNYIYIKEKFQSKLFNLLLNRIVQKKSYVVLFKILKYPLLSSDFILKYLSKKLSIKNSVLRKIIPQLALILIFNFKIKGFKCIISGRINGIQMAKTETFNFNKNSVSCKSFIVKYSSGYINTSYGSLGIKIWLFLK